MSCGVEIVGMVGVGLIVGSKGVDEVIGFDLRFEFGDVVWICVKILD